MSQHDLLPDSGKRLTRTNSGIRSGTSPLKIHKLATRRLVELRCDSRIAATDGAEWFTTPGQVNQRRYEALRAFFVDGLTHAEAGARFGYTRWAMVNLVREYRAGRLELFAPPRKPGPPPGTAPAKDRARGRVIALRRQGLSTYEISARLAAEGTPLNRTSVAEILSEEGFGRLLRHPAEQPPPRRPPPAATPGCPAPPCWTSPPGRTGWTRPRPGCCW